MAKQFHFPLAEKLARICLYIFDYDKGLKADIDEDLLDECRIDDGKNKPTSFACVLSYPDRTVVAYRGTIPTIDDWVKNFAANLVPFRLKRSCVGRAGNQSVTLTGKVHKGFLDELSLVQKKIVTAVKQLHSDDKQLYVTGHSQGGAVAALATAALVEAGFSVEAGYTFAAPRPGDRNFAKAVEKQARIHRVEFGNDIVPHVPPIIPPNVATWLKNPFTKIFLSAASPLARRWLRLADAGYATVGRLAYAEEGRFVLPNITSSQEADLFFDRLRNLIMARKELVEHHSLHFYINAVDRF